MSFNILAINPGSTSTKIGLFTDENLQFEETIRHSTEELKGFDKIVEQKDFRKSVILQLLNKNNFDVKTLDAIVGRGGMLKPIPSGVYSVTDDIIADLKVGVQGQHASNLGGIIAREIADELEIPSYIVDPVVVDELMPKAKISGIPELPKVSAFHALNQKAVAKRYAKEKNVNYADLNLLVVHLGGGVSVGAHIGGKIVDVFNAIDGEGTFSPERAGGVPSAGLIKMCFSGEFTYDEMYKKLIGKGGFNAHLGTNDYRDIEQMVIDGDEHATLIDDAFIYNICKNVGSMSVALKGNVDQIIITGGIAYSKLIIEKMKEQISYLGPITVYPGEDELLALVQGALSVLKGEEVVSIY